MPNWVMNKVHVKGDPEMLSKFLDAVNSEDREFDFNGIIPMPDTVYQGDLSFEDMKKYPRDLNWYDWSCNHWGTKWNACESMVDRIGEREAVIEFQTAWSAPEPIYRAIKEQYPDLNVTVRFADEDVYSDNCGYYRNGRYVPSSNKTFALDVWGWSDDEFED